MGIEIDYALCTHCGMCINSCMMDVIRKKDKRVAVTYSGDCQDCYLCAKDCPSDAIRILPVLKVSK